MTPEQIRSEGIMSAKRAAAAMITFDIDAAALMPSGVDLLDQERAISIGKALRGSRSLSLVSAAAGVTEKQVIAAVLQHHTNCGGPEVCEDYAAQVYLSRRSDDERYEYILRRAGLATARLRRAKTKREKQFAAFWSMVWIMASGVRPFPA